MNAVIISSRSDILTYLADVRADASDYAEAIADQVQHSDHPAWGSDWSTWLAEELPGLIEETVAGVDAIA